MNLPRSTVEAFRANTGGRVVQGYGMTETSPVAIANPIDGNAGMSRSACRCRAPRP